MNSPFHRGESEVQERLGVREMIEPWARRVVVPYLPEQHRAFYEQLPYLVLGARDGAGRPWATFLASEPGFASSPARSSLVVKALPAVGDALDGELTEGSDVGILGIELHTRRRNRVNGQVGVRTDSGFSLEVEQAFGNCPQYIHERGWSQREPTVAPPQRRVFHQFTALLRTIIERADTFFIATGFRGEHANPAFGMDASHRGGSPGFVRVAGESTLLIPDYAGNNHFNTLGNLALDDRAGLLFVDFDSGDTLQLTGRATIEWEHPELASFDGAQRLVRFVLDEAVLLEGALPLRFKSAGGSVRELRVIGKEPESDNVTSFLLEARDGGPLPRFSAGQHLPIKVEIPPAEQPVARTYSISNGPGAPFYRLSVKREPHGLVSRHLHDVVALGDFISAHVPAGDFTLTHEGTRPIVLLSAGVGITPMISMLHELVGTSGGRNVCFIHGARDGAHHPLAEEVALHVASTDHIQLHVAYSRPRAQDLLGRDYHSEGRIDIALLKTVIPNLDADYYLCGPVGFMATVHEGLEAEGIDSENIHSESFGPRPTSREEL